ncbi:hypothetical protein EB169_03255 [archaeon]|jgi:hypothetical protein|nr:hypothetical protein [archaeon]NDB54829.1 hypothetical protein [archaeon]
MNPNNIELENLSKSFEYFKVASEIDSIDDVNELKNIAKCYYKLYLKQQEVVSNLGILNDR